MNERNRSTWLQPGELARQTLHYIVTKLFHLKPFGPSRSSGAVAQLEYANLNGRVGGECPGNVDVCGLAVCAGADGYV